MLCVKVSYDDSKPLFENIDLPDEPISWLNACYDVLGCSEIETIPTVFQDLVFVIDAKGKFVEGWEDRINMNASFLHGNVFDFIVGDAIFARLAGEDLFPLSSHDFDLILFNHFLS